MKRLKDGLKTSTFKATHKTPSKNLLVCNDGSNELYHIYNKPVQKGIFLDNPCTYYVLDKQVILEHVYLTEWGGTDCFMEEPGYSKDHLVSHFQDNTKAFYELRDYAIAVDPKLNINQLYFNINKSRGIFSIKVNGKEEKADFDGIDSWQPTDSLLNATKWTKKDFTTVYTKLNELKCSGIKISEPFSLVFNNNNGCKASFHLYKSPVAKNRFLRNPCNYYVLNDQVILEHIMGWEQTYCFYK